LFSLLISCQTDWEKVANVANVKTSKYARDQFAIIRNKLCGGGKANSDTASPGKKTPTKPKATKAATPRKRKAREGLSTSGQYTSLSGLTI